MAKGNAARSGLFGAVLVLLVLLSAPALAALADFAGTYRGTFAGDDRGTWQFTISPQGAIAATFRSTLEGITYRVSGRLRVSGSIGLVFGSVPSGGHFDGTIQPNGRVTGTWEDPVYGERGTFEGRRIEQTVVQRVRITARAFVPGLFVQPPGIARCGGEVVQAGDDRIDARGRALFNRASNRFRMQEIVTVTATKRGTAIQTRVDRARPRVQPTREFALDALADGRLNAADLDPVRNDCHLLNRQAIGPASDLAMSSRNLGRGKVRIRLTGGARNPLLPPREGRINWLLNITLDFTGARPRYTVAGRHDGFPAFELYLNDRRVYGFDPGRPVLRCGVSAPSAGRLPGYCAARIERLLPPLDVRVRPRSGMASGS